MKLNVFLLSVAAMVNAVSGEDVVDLGTAANYVILSKSGISTVPTSSIVGDIAVSPIAATAITGFSLTQHSSTTYSTSTQVVGQVKAADYTSPTSSELTAAVSDMETAYVDAAGRETTGATFLNLGGGEIGGETLTTGVYTFGTDITINSDVTFKGTSTDVFIIQTGYRVLQAAGTRVRLVGNDGDEDSENIPQAQNIFWSAAEAFTMGDGAHMEGVLLVATSVTMNTESTLNGRILAQTGVVLQQVKINVVE
jgi:hypothetical protein